MATHYDQNCPLCGADAEYCWVDHRNRKYFRCPNCTDFQISRRAEEVLAKHSQQRRDVYAAQAPRASENHLLVIRMPSEEFRQSSSDDLEVRFVSKTELPLNCE